MKKLMAIAVAVVLLLAMAVSAPVAADPAILHVDDDGVQWPGAYTTITAALAVPPGAGDTIIVHQGTYTENVVVSVSVTIVAAAGEPMPVVDASSQVGGVKSGFTIGANNVVIDGLKIIKALGSNDNTAGVKNVGYTGLVVQNCEIDTVDIGIYVSGTATNTKIRNNTITSVSNPATGAMTGQGITVEDPNGFSGLEIIGNSIDLGHTAPSGAQRFGIYLGNTGSELYNYRATYDGAIISHNDVSYSANAAVVIQSVQTTTGKIKVTQNHIHDAYKSGIWMDCSRDVEISHNDIQDNNWGMFLSIYNASVDNHANSIVHNDIHDNNNQGIWLSPFNQGVTPYDITLAHNNVYNNGSQGIRVEGDSNSIHHNSVTSNTGYGIHLTSTSDLNTVHHNTVSGNTAGQIQDDGNNKVFKN